MTTHLFLTGEKRVGKSTLLRALLANDDRVFGGFYTLRTHLCGAESPTVHLLRAGSSEKPSAENFLFSCSPRVGDDAAERFDALGCAALEASRGAELLIMDELGPREAQALRFQAAVLRALDGEIPILGVVQAAESPFLDAVRNHPRVRLVAVTRENRDMLRHDLSRVGL